MKKVLVVCHPGFAENIRNITDQIAAFDVKLISFKDPLWRGKNIIQKTKLLHQYDILHFIWGYAKIWDFMIYKLLGNVCIINHFIGSDLMNIINRSKRKRTELKLCSKISNFAVNGPILKYDLDRLGIDSTELYITNRFIEKQSYQFEDQQNAMAYIPSVNANFYGYQSLVKLAIDSPNVRFTWFPYQKRQDETLPDNIDCIQYIPHKDVLAKMQKHKVLLRLPKHDGMPSTVLEALSIGRWVIWSYPLDHVHHVRDYSELKATFKILIQKTEPNIDGEKFVLTRFGKQPIVNGFYDFYKNVMCT